MTRLSLFLLCSFFAGSMPAWKVPSASSVPLYSYQVIHVYAHDRNAFTQGFEYKNGFLYEGTGLNGRSTLRKEELETGKVVQEITLPAQYFGEGITVLNDRVVQLTWQSHVGFIYNLAEFHLLKNFSYPGEGWGLTNDGRQIYMSDGTPQIRCLDPETLQETRRITVHEGGRAIDELNELEWVKGELYANVWQTEQVARISPTDGSVLGWIDLSHLLTPIEQSQSADVLNGIAYDEHSDRLFVTGKLWPKIFEIRLVHKN